jgi:hypothetical protein
MALGRAEAMEPDELITQIRDAFAEAVCPSALTSGPIGYLHDPLSHFEYDVQNWPDFGIDRAYRYRELLWVFTPEAYRFYLPKFLVAVTPPERIPQTATEAVVLNLFPPPESEVEARARFETRVSLLTGPQVEAVRQFLRFIAERDAEEYAFDDDDEGSESPQRALDRYWSHA